MSFLISAIFIAVLGLATAEVPIVLTAPLSLTTYPLGVRANTTRAANYALVAVNQYSLYIPENASYVSFELNLPADDNNNYLDYDVSFYGPLCDYRYQLHVDGWTCGGFTGEQYVSIGSGSNYNFTFTPARGGEDTDSGSGYSWRTGTNLYFGFTADSSGNDNTLIYPISYVISNVQIVTCANNTIGSVAYSGSEPLCLPLVQVDNNAAFTYDGNYAGGYNGMVFQTTVANNTGLITATLFINSTTVSSISPYMYGKAFGAPTSSEYECGDTTSTVSSDNGLTIINWYCYAPTPGRYYLYFRNGASTDNFTATINITTTTCMGMMGGNNCTVPIAYGGGIPNVNNATTIPLTLNDTMLYAVTIPAGTNYAVNFTFATNGSLYVYSKINGYSSDDSRRGYPSSNWMVDPDSDDVETLSFLPQSISQGVVIYFYMEPYCSSCITLVNMTINTGGATTPSSTSTTGGSSSSGSTRSTSGTATTSGTNSASTSISGTNSRSSSNSNSASRTGTTTATGATSDATTVMSVAALSIALAMLF